LKLLKFLASRICTSAFQVIREISLTAGSSVTINKLKNFKSPVSPTPVSAQSMHCKEDIKYDIITPVELSW